VNITTTIKQRRWIWYLLGATVLAGAFLRLWRIDDFATFLGDQGRDMIVIHEIATFKHFPALGPITSVGSMYLGPLYYYMMAPWLWVTGMSPLGPAIGVALLASAALVAQFFAMRDLFNTRIALLSTALTATSSVLVHASRFSWNPNLLSPASFLLVYALIKSLQTNKLVWYVASGLLLSLTIQLHYLALLLGPFVAIAMIIKLAITPERKTTAINITAAFAGFIILLAPFILFEIIHSFPNIHSFFGFLESGDTQTMNRLNEIIETTKTSFIHAMGVEIAPSTAIVIGIATIIVAMLGALKRSAISIFAAALLTILIGSSLYTGAKFPHYLGPTYILWYVIIAYVFDSLYNTKFGVIIVALFLSSFVFIQTQHYTFFAQGPGPQQIEHAKLVAAKIEENITSDSYRLTALPEQYGSLTYRYYLIKNGKAPLKTEDRENRGDELFVVCDNECQPIGEPLWDIAFFGAEKVLGTYKVRGATIYKLSR